MFTPRPARMLAMAANAASVLVRFAAGMFTFGTLIALNACTVALNCPTGFGIGSGNPSAAEKLAKAFICALSAAAAEAEALAEALADAEAEADALADALAEAEARASADAEAEAAAEAFALAAAFARATASSLACNAAAPPGAIKFTPNCLFNWLTMPPSDPKALSCALNAGRPPGKALRLPLSELTIAESWAEAFALNDAAPIAFKLAAIEAISESLPEAEAESPAEALARAAADAVAPALAFALRLAVAEPSALTAAFKFGIGGKAGGKLPFNPANDCEQIHPTVRPRILR